MKTKSEFGRGLVICLVKFSEHFFRWYEYKKTNEDMRAKGHSIFTESDAVEMFFNGASDHLFEIRVPKKWQGKPIDKKTKELKDFGLMIGHGCTGRTYSEKDVFLAQKMCEEIALLMDKELGLKPDIGEW